MRDSGDHETKLYSLHRYSVVPVGHQPVSLSQTVMFVRFFENLSAWV
jgi:hypothetical protein